MLGLGDGAGGGEGGGVWGGGGGGNCNNSVIAGSTKIMRNIYSLYVLARDSTNVLFSTRILSSRAAEMEDAAASVALTVHCRKNVGPTI